ncbi:DUF349 domain-containing protein [Reinekea marinisedimentorum]|uniref:Uncharacterized protein DUF349 n=1 Tax=Reinekea marinisedimentorum TaxID=230495 RepID=A0A4R3I6K7_9GAMM|nr:DUF349 domain-containing protein [Reinekea marinisedimentorum]TCS41606.1 uncharacterized protein DUF349 [Reinekea marinisedimentorum]
MFRNFFKRKATTPDVKRKPVAQPIVQQPAGTLAQAVEAINTAQPREQAQRLRKLAEKIDNKEWSAEEASGLLQGDARLMVAIEFDLSLPSISEAQWQALVTEGFSAKVKKTAAENIESEALLQSLAKQTRGKDKAVYRILQAKLDAITELKKQQQAALDKQVAILDGLEKLAKASLEPMYEAKLKGLVDQWHAQADVAAEKTARFDQLVAEVREKIDAEKQKAAAEAEAEQVNAEQAVAEEAVQEPVADAEAEPEPDHSAASEARAALLNELNQSLLQTLQQEPLAAEQVTALQQQLLQAQHAWRESEAELKASDADNQRLHQVSTAIEVTLPKFLKLVEASESTEQLIARLTTDSTEAFSLAAELEGIIKELSWLVKTQSVSIFEQIQQALAVVKEKRAELQAQEAEHVRAIRGQLRRCTAAVTDGHLRRASGLFHGAEDMLKKFELEAHAGVKKQYEETREALEKLRDWQAYAVLPKKEALIKRMEALVDQHIDPELRSNSIREMQDEWKLLSRGLQDKHQELWQTFHELADKAYEPCREYFKEQRHLREVNLEKRREVVEQLKTYSGLVNWQQPDVKELDQVLQVARNDWRKYSPVDRMANKKVQAEFDALHKKMFDAMRTQQDVHKAAKQSIIEQSRQLLSQEDVREATEQAKALQQQWKQAGMIARKDEQALWKEFRTVCDELFGRRDEETSRVRADEDANLVSAEKIIAAIEALAEQPPYKAGKSQFNELTDQFRQMGTLPRTRQQKVNAQFNKACETFEQLCAKEARMEKDAQWLAVIDWVKQARFGSADAAAWAEIKLPAQAKGLNERVDAWQLPASEENLALLHDKTIELEILAEADSPEEDSAQRMAMQVSLLSNGVGATNELADFHQQVAAWLAIGAVAQAEYELLEARMKRARQIRLA